MICIFCGQDVSQLKQKPVPVARLEFRPYIGQAEPGQDNLSGLESCQECYEKILLNRGTAIKAIGKIEDKDAH
jgi:hypothetical protein